MSPPAAHPRDALLSLVYGELSAEEANGVQAHVDGCAECAATVDSYRAVRRAASALPREIPSDSGLESLLHYGAQAAARTRRSRTVRWVGSVLGVAVAAGLVLLLALPKAPPETTLASAPAPGAVGPLAQNDVHPVAAAPTAQPEASASLRRVPSAPSPLSEAKTTKARDRAQAGLKREEEGAPQAEDALAPKKANAAAAEVQAAPASQRAAVVAKAQGAATAGANAARGTPVASFTNLPVAADAAPPSVAAGGGPGPAPARLDEARRSTLLQQLAGASEAQRLPILSELCALEARLGLRTEARKRCAQVVESYPGTKEASAAQNVLQGLSP